MSSIWFDKKMSLEMLKPLGSGTMSEHVGIEWVELGSDYLKARLPVNRNTLQPHGLMHGGASCVLAETIGSIGSYLVIDNSKYVCVGMEINANHIRGVRDGFVTGTARPLHLGGTTHVWDIRICNEKEELVCISRLTVAILPRRRD